MHACAPVWFRVLGLIAPPHCMHAFAQVWFIDFGLSELDPTPALRQDEVRQLHAIFQPSRYDVRSRPG